MIKTAKLSEKAKAELCGKIVHVENNLTPNLKFVSDQFGEHMEKIVEDAKIEVSAYVTNVITRAGLQSLTDGKPPIQIAGMDEPED
jgi:hypothetical protein